MKMQKLETKTSEKQIYSLFKFTGFDAGFGLTFVNLLIRTLQNDIFGTAITSFSFEINEKIKLEEIIKEDILDLMFNLQSVVLRSDILIKNTYFLKTKTNKIYTAKNIDFDENISVITPCQYLFTKQGNEDLILSLNVETGKGVRMNKESSSSGSSNINIDTIFSPVIKTSFKIKLDTIDNKLKESVFFEIWTNKSLTPKRCIFEALKIVLKRLTSLISCDNEKEKESRLKLNNRRKEYKNFILDRVTKIKDTYG